MQALRKQPSLRTRRRRRVQGQRPVQAVVLALAWMAAGLGLIFGLSQLPSRLDTLLFFSTALGNISVGLVHLGIGIIQTIGALILIVLVVLSLVLLLGGLVRLARLFNPDAPLIATKKTEKTIFSSPNKILGFQRKGPKI
jgi:type III secretory pathway component EscU